MAKKKKVLDVQGSEITLLTTNKDNYISLTDIDRKFDGNGRHIENWLRNQNTVEYLETWELIHNPDFNSMQLHGIKEKTGLNRFLLSVKKWIELTSAIGIISKAGRYGGTYAHQDIAFNFALWLSPKFQLYVAKEYQLLKKREAEATQNALEWDLNRALSKINHTVHTDAIKENLIPPKLKKGQGFIYAGEADVLNVAVFGITAKMWRIANEGKKGNIRDYATHEQLLVLSNLEAINAELIRLKLSQDERSEILNIAAIKQMQSLLTSPSLGQLPNAGKELLP